MVTTLVPGSSGPGLSPGRGHCVVFLCVVFSQRLSPPRSINGYRRIVGEILTNCWGVTCDGPASRSGGVEILLAASCYGNRDKLRPDEPVGSKDFTHSQLPKLSDFQGKSTRNGLMFDETHRDPETGCGMCSRGCAPNVFQKPFECHRKSLDVSISGLSSRLTYESLSEAAKSKVIRSAR